MILGNRKSIAGTEKTTHLATASMKEAFEQSCLLSATKKGPNTMIELELCKTEEKDKGTPQPSSEVSFSCWVESVQKDS